MKPRFRDNKDLYKLPFNLKYTGVESLLYPDKHDIILEKQKRLNKKHKDRRQIKNILLHTNSNNETFLFGRYGGEKNQTLVTIGQVVGDNWIILEK